jgi:hypothetical protein
MTWLTIIQDAEDPEIAVGTSNTVSDIDPMIYGGFAE